MDYNKRDSILLSNLRKNGDKSILQIAKDNNIPKSTMFDTYRALKDKEIFKHTILIDFERVGFTVKVFYVIKTNMKCRTQLRLYLKAKENINSLYDLGLGADFLFEGIFRNFREVHKFEEGLEEKFDIFEKQMFNVIDNVKVESFLSNGEELLTK